MFSQNLLEKDVFLPFMSVVPIVKYLNVKSFIGKRLKGKLKGLS